MNSQIMVCGRCGESAYDSEYKRCLNDDCHLAPAAEKLHLALVTATALMLGLMAASFWIF